ncbi:MAG: glutaredoxin family protein [Bacteroidetes bacterium]|nr:glutaredoxin family protein [Bacteroidota bacterium]
MIQVTLISTDSCKLCTEALEQLKALQREIPFLIREQKISRESPEFNRYKSKFPVILYRDEEVTCGRIDLSEIRNRISQ